MMELLQRAAKNVGDVLFPPVCVACGRLVEGGGLRHVCRRCEQRIVVVSDPACPVCGHPHFGEVAGERLCPHCESLVPAYGQGRTCVLCKDPVRALVHELKYRQGTYCLCDIEALMRRSARVLGFIRDAVLVPVPLHPRKKRERGYNQSLLLAVCFARAAGGATRIEEVLRRDVDTISQTAFDRTTRRDNLKNAFSLRPDAVINKQQHYVLVDDVFTTGSTLNSCAVVLRRAGCLKLDVVTFGHG